MGAISINYPTARMGDPQSAIDEWHRQIGFLDYEEALSRMDAWMESPEGSRPPRAVDLKKSRPMGTRYPDDKPEGSLGPYLVDRFGNLTNYEGMLYAYPKWADAKFMYNRQGDICFRDTGIIAIKAQEVRRRKEIADQRKKEEDNGERRDFWEFREKIRSREKEAVQEQVQIQGPEPDHTGLFKQPDSAPV